MKVKDRITAYVGTNADRTCKLPMAIIGTPMNPRCLRLGKPPVPYFSQRNAWSESVTFKKWFYNLFIPFVRRKRPSPLLSSWITVVLTVQISWTTQDRYRLLHYLPTELLFTSLWTWE